MKLCGNNFLTFKTELISRLEPESLASGAQDLIYLPLTDLYGNSALLILVAEFLYQESPEFSWNPRKPTLLLFINSTFETFIFIQMVQYMLMVKKSCLAQKIPYFLSSSASFINFLNG